MKNNLVLTPAQAAALARLLRTHLEAYEEAMHPCTPPRETEPLCGSDLDLLEPLVALLDKIQQKARNP